MILDLEELDEHLLTLLKARIGQKQTDRMLLMITQRLESHGKPTMSFQEVNAVVSAVYQEWTQEFDRQARPALKQLEELAKRRKWASPLIKPKGSRSRGSS